MQRAPSHTKSYDRRRFIGNTVKLVLLGSILPFESCNNKKNADGHRPPGKKGSNGVSKNSRQKWSHESLVINTKTQVMHFPTSKVYRYYDEIKSGHLKEISMAAWMTQLGESARMNKEQSGNITEIMTLQELGKEINDTNLIMAIDSLSVAFREEYQKSNNKNFRLHELMLQLVALNNSIPAESKWVTFNAKVVKPSQLRKRQKWMENETNFNERVKYILDREDEYKARLSKRAAKYSFT